MGAVTMKVDPSGRVVIPHEVREALGIPDGGELLVTVEDGELRASTRLAALRRIQRELKTYVPAGTSVVDEFLAEKRAEVAREEAKEEEWRRARDEAGLPTSFSDG
jgi:AbrB family looped-hinge helix DNA binding protein